MTKTNLEIGQIWISESHPYESFKIYDGVGDGNVVDFYVHDFLFTELPEKAKIYFWKRVDQKAFEEFITEKKGENYDSTYPWAWCGESKKNILVNKIRKYNMVLKEDKK